MKTIEWTSSFKSDYKRLLRSPRYRQHADFVLNLAESLALGIVLDPKHDDHALTGNWKHHRECHLAPDLLLIYRYRDADAVILLRLGTHSELFG